MFGLIFIHQPSNKFILKLYDSALLFDLFGQLGDLHLFIYFLYLLLRVVLVGLGERAQFGLEEDTVLLLL